ncbi:hypothetical protein, partial [Paenibacillus nuruki]|uniref:hypothetical protein n=1 Tax=Paenibacillus nuruki TaxID=1886670 RepID=UPI001112D609
MDLGYGEYINISACLRMPYNTSKVFELLNELELKNTQFQEVTILLISPSVVNYDLVWEGAEEITQNFSYKLLEQYVLSSLDMVIDHCIPARMIINFLDTDSYEVSISLNFQKIEEETQQIIRQEKFKHIEQLALNIFKAISPVYALLGIEKSVIGLNGIINDFFSFPTDKV